MNQRHESCQTDLLRRQDVLLSKSALQVIANQGNCLTLLQLSNHVQEELLTKVGCGLVLRRCQRASSLGLCKILCLVIKKRHHTKIQPKVLLEALDKGLHDVVDLFERLTD